MKRVSWLVGLLLCVLLMNGCTSRTGQAQTSPTPFPTLPAIGTNTPVSNTPTPHIFQPGKSEQATPSPTPPARNSIPVDGELVSVYPSLEVIFPKGVSGELLTLHVQLGQRVEAGDLIATLDDGELQKAIKTAQLALDKAVQEKARAEKEAERAYQRAKEQAEWALKMAKHDLSVAELLPPTVSLRQAEVNLARLREVEELAAERYKQALDKPWEKQEVRDALYKEWQRLIVDRELAEMGFRDLQTNVRIYYIELEFKKETVKRAEAALAQVEKGDTRAYDEAVAEAERELADAQALLEHTKLYAPRNGLVIRINAFEGSMVDGNVPVVTLLNAEDLYFVTLNLSERHAALVRPGQRAEIALRFYPDLVFAGEVEMVLPLVESQSEARFAAYIRLSKEGQESSNNELNLWPGMTGRAEIALEGE